MLLAAHVSRAHTLTEWLDPSIIDENDPTRRDARWNLYDPACAQPPYSADFLAEFRARQLPASDRITAWAERRWPNCASREGPHAERAFIVHGTMADPRWLDPAVDANDRVPGRCYLGDPRLINDSPGGLGRFTTLRSWLSQWSQQVQRRWHRLRDAHLGAGAGHRQQRRRCLHAEPHATTPRLCGAGTAHLAHRRRRQPLLRFPARKTGRSGHGHRQMAGRGPAGPRHNLCQRMMIRR